MLVHPLRLTRPRPCKAIRLERSPEAARGNVSGSPWPRLGGLSHLARAWLPCSDLFANVLAESVVMRREGTLMKLGGASIPHVTATV